MGSELFQRSALDRLNSMDAISPLDVPPSAFDNFFVGTGKTVMHEFAKYGSAIDLAGSVGPIVKDAFTGGTERQDRYFREHDETFNSAVDYWVPSPNEVGVAGQVTGQLLSLLPVAIASPGLAIGATQLGVGQELVRKGVDATRAQLVGGIQGVGLGLGIWMPVLGTSLAQKVLLGGAGFNVAQGVASRGASGAILEGTPAEGEYKAFDPAAITLDALLGMAFGGVSHLSKEKSAEWEKIKQWAENLTPSDRDALSVLRDAQHINEDSLPAKPVDLVDADRAVAMVRSAINQLSQDKDIIVSELSEPKFEAQPERMADQQATAESMVAEAERLMKDQGWKEPQLETPLSPVETASTPPPEVESPARGGAIEEVNVVAQAADRFVAEHPEHTYYVGTDASGKPITQTAENYLKAEREAAKQAVEDAKLFQVAADCLLGG